ncbi:MAG: dUTP diphosphatase [Pseudomonadota bacterium]
MSTPETQYHQMLLTMLSMQNAMNQKVHSQWQTENYAWHRAIWVECAELLDHYGWKWWKKQTPDAEQVALELVDIFHFGLSCFLNQGLSDTEIAQHIEEAFQQAEATDNTADFREVIEAIAATALTEKRFDFQNFYTAMRFCEMSVESLFQQYVGKNTLNFFRQDNGYKTGEYQKTWNGQEDNEHLAEILQALDASDVEYPKQVYQALESRYPQNQ